MNILIERLQPSSISANSQYSVEYQQVTKTIKQKRQLIFINCRFQSEWGDSNARPLRPERSALPTALHSDFFVIRGGTNKPPFVFDGAKIGKRFNLAKIKRNNFFLVRRGTLIMAWMAEWVEGYCSLIMSLLYGYLLFLSWLFFVAIWLNPFVHSSKFLDVS